MFVVRNVANLCVNTDHSLLAALTYAVNVLEVRLDLTCSGRDTVKLGMAGRI